MVALVWANSPWSASYHAVWATTLLGQADLHFVVNDGLMTLFFFSVGLEIRHEMHDGVLSDLRGAALPLAAALGGMLVPALIYVALNAGGPALSGWGIPMATDIAFAVGVLSLLGTRAPPALRVLLLALAVIDDVGAIVVIAVFYSAGVSVIGLAVAAVGVLIVLAMRRLGVGWPWAYVPVGLLVWIGVYRAGIHPTLAGVVLGLLTPVDVGARLQRGLKPWVDRGVMPLFALANAGVTLGAVSLAGAPLRLLSGVGVGLVVGKPIGVVAFVLLSTRLGLARLAAGLGMAHVVVLGLAAGIGFTMSLFIAQLAFPGDANQLETAKLGVLCGSVLAALACTLGGRSILRTQKSP